MPRTLRRSCALPPETGIPPQGLPVLEHEAGSRFAVLGMARSARGAARIVREHLSAASRALLDNHGFELHVFRRSALMRELNGGPDGFVWSIGGAPGPASKRR